MASRKHRRALSKPKTTTFDLPPDSAQKKDEYFVESLKVKLSRGKYGTLRILRDDDGNDFDNFSKLIEQYGSEDPSKPPDTKPPDSKSKTEAQVDTPKQAAGLSRAIINELQPYDPFLDTAKSIKIPKVKAEELTKIDEDDVLNNYYKHKPNDNSIELTDVEVSKFTDSPSHISEKKHSLSSFPPKKFEKPPFPTKEKKSIKQEIKKERENELIEPPSELSLKLIRILDHYSVISLSILLTILALILKDISLLLFPASSDLAINCILLIIFIYFVIEMIINLFAQPRYYFYFFFVCDFIGTFALLFDFPLILEPLGVNFDEHEDIENSLQSTWIRQARVLRIFRLVHILKYLPTTLLGNVELDDIIMPSRAGRRLADIISKKLYATALILLIVLPLLSSFPLVNQHHSSVKFGVDLMSSYTNTSSAEFLSITNQFQESHSDLLQLKINNDLVYTSPSYDKKVDDLRGFEFYEYSRGNSYSLLSKRSIITMESAINISIIFLVVFAFFFASLLIKRDMHVYFSVPLQQVTKMLTKLSTTICLMDKDADTHTEMRDNISMVTTILKQKVAHIFGMARTAAVQQAELLKNTSQSNVIPPLSVENTSMKSLDGSHQVYSQKSERGGALEKTPSYTDLSYSSLNDPELSSVRTILNNSLATSQFKMFLRSNLRDENLLFYQDVQKYKDFFHNFAEMIYETYLSHDSSHPINISGYMSQTIIERIDNPDADLFSPAQDEVLGLMEEVLDLFWESPFCNRYLQLKRHKTEEEAKKSEDKKALDSASNERKQRIMRERAYSLGISKSENDPDLSGAEIKHTKYQPIGLPQATPEADRSSRRSNSLIGMDDDLDGKKSDEEDNKLTPRQSDSPLPPPPPEDDDDISENDSIL